MHLNTSSISLDPNLDTCPTSVAAPPSHPPLAWQTGPDMSTDELNDQSLSEWARFLDDYANGRFSSTAIPKPPTIPPDVQTDAPVSPSLDIECPLYSSVEITPQIAGRVRDFYAEHSYLPPPRAPLESLREQCILEYDMYSEQQSKNVQAATDLLQAFFGGICTFTLFRNNVQELVAVSGSPEVLQGIGLHAGLRLLPESSLCGHTVLFPTAKFFVQNLASDWRYAGNPYADPLNGIKSYIGSVVSLNVDPASPTEDRVVPVGVFNLFYLDGICHKITPDQEKVIENVSRMLETQLRATWEGQGKTREARARRGVSDLLENILVTPGQKMSRNPSPSSLRSNGGDQRGVEGDALEALNRLKTVMEEMSSGMIIDLSSLQVMRRPSQVQSSHAFAVSPGSHTRILAQHHPPVDHDHHALDLAVTQLLGSFSSTTQTQIYNLESPSGMEAFLPVSTTSHIVAPFFTGDQPLFLIVVGKSVTGRRFGTSESNFVRSIGVVLLAKMLQSRVVKADMAKTVFLSSISHELRTPMHGILSGLQLVREAINSSNMEQAERLLVVIESSGYTLQHILNDVLDFGVVSQDSTPSRESDGPATSQIDLKAAALSVAGTCARRLDAEGNSKVKMLVECEERDWRANIDAAGFQRILLNGLTNALKFTQEGSITLSMSTNITNSIVTCRVIDTGIGVDPTFALRLFEPFTKQDSFSPGAGLGLYITRALTERMGGSITLAPGEKGGSVFTFTCPVDLVSERPDLISTSICELTSDTRSNIDSVNGQLSALSIVPDSPPAEVASPREGVSPKESPSPVEGALRVLVVDDNHLSRKILVTLFEQLSRRSPITVTQACDGVEALEVFKDFRPHLVLTDVSMPRMDGIASASGMREMEREWGVEPSRIYAITGLGSSDRRMTTDALKGTAQLDGWLIKGKDQMGKVKEIVEEVKRAL